LDDAERECFNDLENTFLKVPVLCAPIFDEEFILTTDANLHGMVAVLSQLEEKGDEKPVAFIT
jgi:RNase H-like domain found in reverse transcriptase